MFLGWRLRKRLPAAVFAPDSSKSIWAPAKYTRVGERFHCRSSLFGFWRCS